METGQTGLEYNYQEALEINKFSLSMKKVLPFIRKKVDYANHRKQIDISKLKNPNNRLRGRALRR